jgi:hypothetical protein
LVDSKRIVSVGTALRDRSIILPLPLPLLTMPTSYLTAFGGWMFGRLYEWNRPCR